MAEPSEPLPEPPPPGASSTLDAVLAASSPSLARRIGPWLLFLLVVAGLGAAGFVFATREVPVEVDVFVAGRGEVEGTIPSVSAGRVVARRRARVAAEVVGRVIELRVKEGDRVEKGRVIVQLDDTEARANLAQAESAHRAAVAAVAEAEARVATMRSVRDRRAKQVENQTATPEVLDMAKLDLAVSEASLEVVKARVSQAAAGVDLARAVLAKHAVKAPFDGVISELWVELGESTTAAGASPGGGKAQAALALEAASRLFELIATDDLYLTAPVDEVDLARLSPGLGVRVTLDPWPKEPFLAKLVRVAPYVLDVEEQNRTVEIEVDVPELVRAKALKPGISADVEVIVDRREDVLRLPIHALLENDRVLVVERDELGRERAVERRLELGVKNWRACEVRKGLVEGERVIAHGVDGARVKAGALVRVRRALDSDAKGDAQGRRGNP